MKGDKIMDLQDYKDYLKTAFPEAVQHAIEKPEEWFVTDKKIKQAARIHHKEWGFRSPTDCFAGAVPRSIRLQLGKWSMSEVAVDHWKMDVSCRAFYLGGSHAHIEVRNTGCSTLPITETGYKSFFVPLGARLRRILSGRNSLRFLNLNFSS